MQFVVPQFIEVETKIIGPISARQFIILLVAAGLIYGLYELATFWLFAIGGVFILAAAGIIAFVRINSQPFHIFGLNLIQTLKRPKLRIWYKTLLKFKEKKLKEEATEELIIPKKDLNISRLTELSLVVDTGGAYIPEEQRQPMPGAKAKPSAAFQQPQKTATNKK